MDMNLKNKIAVVTGGANGIGKEISLVLAGEGAVVIVNYHSDEQAAQQVVEKIRSSGGDALAIGADISDFDQTRQMMDRVKLKFSRVDILVNNAGITNDNLLMRMPPEDWSRVIDTNLTGVFNCSKALIVGMMRQKSGRIINVSSVSGIAGLPGQTNYSASKGGINAFTKALAKEVGSLGITVNAVAPGFVESKMTDALSEKQREREIQKIPMGRFGTPWDVAGLVLFLASDLSGYITGQIISIDGGLYG